MIPGLSRLVLLLCIASHPAIAEPTGIRVPGKGFLPFLRQPVPGIPAARRMALGAGQDFPKKLALVTHSRYIDQLPSLDGFIAAKQARGFEAVVLTEQDWNPESHVGDEAADTLRAWLAANHEAEGIGYVLLAGHPDPHHGLVPMKMTWGLKYLCEDSGDPIWCDLQAVPTDAYFSDLDGNWDLDGDGYFAEYPDDTGAGGVNFEPEVLVGRFPVHHDPVFLDAYLAITAQYENASAAGQLHGRNRVLLPAAMLGFRGLSPGMPTEDGAHSLDKIGENLASISNDLVFTRMFEAEGFRPSFLAGDYALNREHLINAFRYGHGLTVWYAHGYPTYTGRMVWDEDRDSDGQCDFDEYRDPAMLLSFDTSQFQDAHCRTFTWQISCQNGYPEVEYNMGAMMLLYGAVGAIVASRSALGEDATGPAWSPEPSLACSESVAHTWSANLASGMTNGEALAMARVANPSDGWDEVYPPDLVGASYMGLGLHTKLVYNLYGDPSLRWVFEAGEHDPDWPWTDAEPTEPETAPEADADAADGRAADADGEVEADWTGCPTCQDTSCPDHTRCGAARSGSGMLGLLLLGLLAGLRRKVRRKVPAV